MEDRNVKRGDIYHADLDPVFGSEQGGYRPVLVIQNNIGNNQLVNKPLKVMFNPIDTKNIGINTA